MMVYHRNTVYIQKSHEKNEKIQNLILIPGVSGAGLDGFLAVLYKKDAKIPKQKSEKKIGKFVEGIRRIQLASPEPNPAPREAEVMEGSRKPST